jgi:Family of unknown function (DUF6169)
LQNPYNLREEDGDFVFTTDLGLEYRIVFQKYNAFDELGYSSYEFSFYPFGKPNTSYDHRIKLTIIESLKTFFEQNPDSVLIYICDSMDMRARERNVLFNRWFRDATTSNDTIKLNRKIYDTQNDMVYYFAVVFNQNYIPQSVIESFMEVEIEAYNK